MSFIWPAALFLLAAIPLAIALVWWLLRRREQPGVAHPDIDLLLSLAHKPHWRRFFAPALGILAFAAFTVGLARPKSTIAVPREQATIVLAIDVSGSMGASDVAPFRLRAAQDAAASFAEKVPRQYQVGLVTFSGQASLLVPPTTDRISLNAAIDGLAANGDTAIGDAVMASLDAIQATQPGATPLVSARILLLSDGKNRAGVTVEEAAARAKNLGVPIFTVALGTPDGTLPDGAGGFEPVPPDPEGLKKLSGPTGGRSYESRDAGSVSAVYDQLGTFIGTDSVPSESTGWWALAGSLLLAASAAAVARFGTRLG